MSCFVSRKVHKHLAGLLMALAFLPAAHATLELVYNGQVVYDTATNLSWVSNANLAASNTFGVSGIDPNGTMSWATAKNWIAAMNAADYLGYSDWQLPVTGPLNGNSFNYIGSYNGSTDFGYNQSAPGTAYAGSKGSQMAYLFYNSLDNRGLCNATASTATNCVMNASFGLTHTGPFTNFQSFGYWSGTEYAPEAGQAWGFATLSGAQSNVNETTGLDYALAVRFGDVSALPEVDTWAMLVVGLGVIGMATKQLLGGRLGWSSRCLRAGLIAGKRLSLLSNEA